MQSRCTYYNYDFYSISKPIIPALLAFNVNGIDSTSSEKSSQFKKQKISGMKKYSSLACDPRKWLSSKYSLLSNTYFKKREYSIQLNIFLFQPQV